MAGVSGTADRAELCELTNMVMVTDGQGNVLVQERNDPDWPGVVFPGGHVERGEAFAASAAREVKEETGLEVRDLRLCGVQQFPAEGGSGNRRYIVFCYRTSSFGGSLKSSAEGRAFWLPRAELFSRRTAESFRDIVRVFEEDGLNELCWREEESGWVREYL